MAASSLLSTVAFQYTSSAGLPRPSARLGTPLVPPSLRLSQAPPSLHLGPLSLRLHRGLPDPRLLLSHRSHLFCLGPPDPPRHTGSSALRLRIGLHLHHGSSLRRLHPGSPSWLGSGSCLAPPAPSCLFPGSSLCLIHPGLCLSSSSCMSFLCLNLHLYCLPAFLPALCHPLSPSLLHSLCPPPKARDTLYDFRLSQTKDWH